MSNIAITGHTSGIGLGLFKKFQSEGHNVIGFSRSNGHDLRDANTLDKIIDSLKLNSIDTIVINAHFRFSQVNLLYSVAKLWDKQRDKTIIVMSSIAGNYVMSQIHVYNIEKTALDKACQQLSNFHSSRILNVRPGYVDTPRVSMIESRKIPVDRIVDTIFWFWSAPDDFSVSEISILPRKD
jgi:nucleoside-diphosphate-sugar epimerase